MDWRKGYTSTYYMTLVNSTTWRDVEKYEITGGSVRFESSNLRTSADVDCRNYTYTDERLIRIWMDTSQEGEDGAHVALFTGYVSSPNRRIEGVKETRTLQCYSVLLPASDVLLPRGWYAPLDTDGATLIRTLLGVTKAPLDISNESDDNRRLKQAIIAEQNETNLSMVEKLLSAMNWRMWISGDGAIHVGPFNTEARVTFDTLANDIIETTITEDYDWFDCPNVIRVIMDEDSAISYDYDSDTPMSINNRGREVWYEETDVVLNDEETLQSYADRRLKELQRFSKTLSYDRRYWQSINEEGLYPLDVIRIKIPQCDIFGKFIITSQTITLGFNAKTSEEVIAV